MSDFIPAFFFDGRVPGWHGKRCYQWDWPTSFPMILGIDVEMPAQGEIEASYPKMHRAGDQIPASNCLFKEEMSPWDSAVCSPLFVETAEGVRVQREIEASYPKMHRAGDQIPASNCLFKEEMSPWDSAVCSPLFVETAEGMRVQREIEASYPKIHRDGPKSAIFIFCIIGKAGIANRGIGVDVSL